MVKKGMMKAEGRKEGGRRKLLGGIYYVPYRVHGLAWVVRRRCKIIIIAVCRSIRNSSAKIAKVMAAAIQISVCTFSL